ncbi:MAG: L,D-transpeptidase [Firmicutes bacterium]|nr:L,D-transpeptidase [Bacillota bacterium]
MFSTQQKRYIILVLGALLICVVLLFSGRTIRYFMNDEHRFFNQPAHYTNSKIIIYKKERELELYADDKCIGIFKVALGSKPVGEKNKEGDNRTPEGEYFICTRHDQRTNNGFFLGISYPNISDAQRNLDAGAIDRQTFDQIKAAIDKQKQPPWDTPLGGAIGIHGGGNGINWTAGCIALANKDIDIVKDYAPLRTPVIIYASRKEAP